MQLGLLKKLKGQARNDCQQNMMRDDHEVLLSKKSGYCKWFYNQSVTTLFSNVEEITFTSTILQHQ